MFPIYAVPLTLHRFLSMHGKKMKPVPFPPPLCIMPAHFISFSIHRAKLSIHTVPPTMRGGQRRRKSGDCDTITDTAILSQSQEEDFAC